MDEELNGKTEIDPTQEKKQEISKKKRTSGFHRKNRKKENVETALVEVKENTEKALTKVKEKKDKALIPTSKNKALDIRRKNNRKSKGKKQEDFRFKSSPIKIIPLGGLLEI